MRDILYENPMIKRFLEWIQFKEKLHEKKVQIPYVSEGDIWLGGAGENIGWEINGKSGKFSRPVIILKKLKHGLYFVIPTTTKLWHGTWFVKFRHGLKTMSACLHQVRVIDYRRLYSRIGELDKTDFKRIKDGFKNLYT